MRNSNHKSVSDFLSLVPFLQKANAWAKYLLIILFVLCVYTSSSREKNILVIHSYHQGLEWTDSISSGILSVFNNNHDFNLYFEYLDTKRNSSDNYFNSLVELYRSRSSKIKYDAIITSDNAAYGFMLEYRDELFPEVPVFYCGVNFLDRAELSKHDKFYGYEEIANHAGTIDLIKQLFPERKKVLIINDHTLTGNFIRSELESVLMAHKNDLQFEFIETFSIKELEQRVATLSDEYTIYLLVVNMDRLGNYISYNKGIQVISENTAVPIFGSWDFYLNKGIIGGAITKGFEQGENIAQLSYDYLRGENLKPAAYQKGKTTLCLDYSLLEQFNLEKSINIKGVSVINKPAVSVWKIRVLKTTIVVLLLVLIGLFINVHIKRAQAKKLKKLVELRTRELKVVNRDLERINQSKNEILGIVAHDLRNPIGNINGFSKYIIDEDEEHKMLNEESKECIQIINDVSTYMLGLVNNLLDISVIDSGALKLDLQNADYLAFIADELAHNKALADSKQMSIKLISCVDNAFVRFDKIKLQQAFLNLLSNAIKFSKAGDVITVELVCERTKIITKIKDSGPGIPSDKFDAIFGKFEQLHSATGNKNKGAGLGLSIVKGIIEAHNGRIYVQSELNAGAEFIYELPVLV